MAAWGYALKHNNNDEEKAKAFVGELFERAPVLDSGARGSTTTFVERGIGDVLLAWENEAFLSVKELGPDKFDIVVPSVSILAEPPVAIVDKNADKKGSRDVADAYLKYLYSERGKKTDCLLKIITAQRWTAWRKNSKISSRHLNCSPLKDVFGTWRDIPAKHFNDGGIFDQIYVPGKVALFNEHPINRAVSGQPAFTG